MGVMSTNISKLCSAVLGANHESSIRFWPTLRDKQNVIIPLSRNSEKVYNGCYLAFAQRRKRAEIASESSSMGTTIDHLTAMREHYIALPPQLADWLIAVLITQPSAQCCNSAHDVHYKANFHKPVLI